MSIGFWNNRVVKKVDYFGEDYFEVHEVYYNKDGTIYAMTTNPIVPYGISVVELKETLERMIRASDKPFLVDGDVTFINYEDGDGEEFL